MMDKLESLLHLQLPKCTINQEPLNSHVYPAPSGRVLRTLTKKCQNFWVYPKSPEQQNSPENQHM